MKSLKEVAGVLGISPQTVANFRGMAFRDLGAAHHLAAALREDWGMDLRALAQGTVLVPLGILHAEWRVDPQGVKYGGAA